MSKKMYLEKVKESRDTSAGVSRNATKCNQEVSDTATKYRRTDTSPKGINLIDRSFFCHKVIGVVITLFLLIQTNKVLSIMFNNGVNLALTAKRGICHKVVALIVATYSFSQVYSDKAILVLRSLMNIVWYQIGFDFDTFTFSIITICRWLKVNFKNKETSEATINRLFETLLFIVENKTSYEWKISILSLLFKSYKPRKGNWLLSHIRKAVNGYLNKKIPGCLIWLNELLMNSFLSEIIYATNLLVFDGTWNTTRFLLNISYGIFKLVFLEHSYKRLNEVSVLFCFLNALSIIGCPYLSMTGYTTLGLMLLITTICVSPYTKKKQE